MSQNDPVPKWPKTTPSQNDPKMANLAAVM